MPSKKVKPYLIDIHSDLDDYLEPKPDVKTLNQILKSPPPPRRASRRTGAAGASLLPSELQKRPSTESAGEIDELKFKDPIGEIDKTRIKDLTKDYAIMSAVGTLIHYVLGRQMKATLYPVTREQLNTQAEVDEALANVLTEFNLPPDAFAKFQQFTDMVDLNCELDRYLRIAMAQAYFYDRAALWVIRANSSIMQKKRLVDWGFREDVPTGFRPLDSFSLGQVTVDTKSWEPKKIEYRGNLGSIDRSSGSRRSIEQIDAEDLVYFTRNDYNIIPDSYNYGSLGMGQVLEVSESIRRVNKKVFPEVTNNQWAGTHIIEMEGTSEAEVATFVNGVRPGRSKVTNQPIKIHDINPKFDMRGTIDLRSSHILNILLKVGVPSFIMNFEDIPNVATAQTVAFIWQETKLEDERNWIRSTLWRQWYRPLMMFYFNQDEQEFLDMRVKVIAEFKSIEFASIFEKAIAINTLRNAGVLTEREGREMVNLPPFPPDQDEDLELASQILAENPDLIPVLKQLAAERDQQDQAMSDMENGNGNGEGNPDIERTVSDIRKPTSPSALLGEIKRKSRNV